VLGEAAVAGRDKLTLHATPGLSAFPAWIEQLVAESTGKDGTGILPVVDEPILTGDGEAAGYGDDRVFVHLTLAGSPAEEDVEPTLAALEQAGHPVVRVRLPDELELGAQMILWEVAVAAAGQVLGIHPFNQPDVELAKQRAKEALKDQQGPDGSTGSGGSGGSGGNRRGETPGVAVDGDELASALSEWAHRAEPPRYAAIQAFLHQTVETDQTLRALRLALAERTGVATTAGYGPRFLHSTGQLHKGGQDTGLYLQLVDSPAEDLPVPETDTSFRALIRAQAVGDFKALEERDRQVLRVELGEDAAGGLARILEQLRGMS
jgi:transaldolase/glucose-6-phosphate isomerase